MVEAGLDYPDEDLPDWQVRQMEERLEFLAAHLKKVAATFDTGSLLLRGAKIVIAGSSNAGKSSLLNRILNEDRALVDSAPGTTRDIVEAAFFINGIAVTFYDTAGLRMGAKAVEQAGIEKSRQAVSDADIVLLVTDGAVSSDINVSDTMLSFPDGDRKLINVVNKCDLPEFTEPEKSDEADTVNVSAKTGYNIDKLLKKIGGLLNRGDDSDIILTTERQQNTILMTVDALLEAVQLFKNNSDPELAAAQLRWARDSFSALWGRHAQTDVTDRIFSSFCLGK
jgi:tRNA modification GTPase